MRQLLIRRSLRGFVRLLPLVLLPAVAEPSGEEVGAEMRDHQIADEGEDEHRDDVADEPLQPQGNAALAAQFRAAGGGRLSGPG